MKRVLVLAAGLAGCASPPNPAEPEPAAQICGVEDGPNDPQLRLWHYGEPVTDGAVLRVDCGPQGAFMINVIPELSGFAPETEWLEVELTMDVPGFNLGPDELFYEVTELPYYVGCEEQATSFAATLPFLVPDEISDVEALNGRSGTLRVTVQTPMGSLVEEHPFTIAAENVGDYYFCYG